MKLKLKIKLKARLFIKLPENSNIFFHEESRLIKETRKDKSSRVEMIKLLPKAALYL